MKKREILRKYVFEWCDNYEAAIDSNYPILTNEGAIQEFFSKNDYDLNEKELFHIVDFLEQAENKSDFCNKTLLREVNSYNL